MSQFLFPQPRDWEVFEDIVCDVLCRRYDSHNLQRYGRKGQKQCGVDIVGFTREGLVGVQCKHHPNGVISTSEIDKEVKKSEAFRPILDKLIIMTSAARDREVHSHVLAMTEQRLAQGKYPVEIEFWDNVVGELEDYPDLLYKHFTRYFSPVEFEHIKWPRLGATPKHTISWPATSDTLEDVACKNLDGLRAAEPYTLAIGFSTFEEVGFEGLVDLDINLHHLASDEENAAENFQEAYCILANFKAALQPPFFSKKLVVHLQARLNFALLLGWVFRRVTGFNLQLVSRGQVWGTEGLPPKNAGIVDDLPVFLGPKENREIALILNISRDTETEVLAFLEGWESPPSTVWVSSLPNHSVTSAAHALAVATEISWKIKNLGNRSGIQHIHLFGAFPAPLATLIGFQLNAICPISTYFVDNTRSTYRWGGTITNNM